MLMKQNVNNDVTKDSPVATVTACAVALRYTASLQSVLSFASDVSAKARCFYCVCNAFTGAINITSSTCFLERVVVVHLQ